MGVKVWSLTSDRKMCVQKLCRIVRVLMLNKSTCVCVSVCVHLHLKKTSSWKNCLFLCRGNHLSHVNCILCITACRWMCCIILENNLITVLFRIIISCCTALVIIKSTVVCNFCFIFSQNCFINLCSCMYFNFNCSRVKLSGWTVLSCWLKLFNDLWLLVSQSENLLLTYLFRCLSLV